MTNKKPKPMPVEEPPVKYCPFCGSRNIEARKDVWQMLRCNTCRVTFSRYFDRRKMRDIPKSKQNHVDKLFCERIFPDGVPETLYGYPLIIEETITVPNRLVTMQEE